MTTQTPSFRELIGVQPSTVSVQDSVLIIIDAQNEYAQGHLTISQITSSRNAISSLLTKYRTAHAPLAHIVHQVPSGAPVFTPGTALAQEFEELTPENGEKVIVKQYPSAFTGTDLEAFIKGTGKSKVVLVGYMAHVCVSTTARQAAEKGYDVLLVGDAIGDRDIPGVKAEELVKTVLAELADAFGTVVQSGEIN
ncbi:putative isochorismatase family hydrolase [Sclerotinia borealis F-4128]|uniref:Putative isochorismatase family hydrolase n=1 Tax=Sclerotinia borealis (strain F-4128) TaxID=1432307 RepID=W9CTG0_SCLBF|nr:putative isochorismatase family hydrolase [Sclerotinia borealis F-4128]